MSVNLIERKGLDMTEIQATVHSVAEFAMVVAYTLGAIDYILSHLVR